MCVREREEKSKMHIRSFATPFSLIRFAISKMIIAYELLPLLRVKQRHSVRPCAHMSAVTMDNQGMILMMVRENVSKFRGVHTCSCAKKKKGKDDECQLLKCDNFIGWDEIASIRTLNMNGRRKVRVLALLLFTPHLFAALSFTQETQPLALHCARTHCLVHVSCF